jgi:thioredoxin reductase (NADPH)
VSFPYLGFPAGISGLDLTGRAYAQAQKFGRAGDGREGRSQARLRQTSLRRAPGGWRSHQRAGHDHRVGSAIPQARDCQRVAVEGAGVYYSASRMESQLCAGDEVAVVGSGNSAGQAAVFLAETAKHVHLLVRKDGLMTGAVPNTGWLAGCVALDGRGFVKTGPDLSPEDLTTGGWPLARSPYLLETNRPGVFAVGDVRGGNIKRVASAVGEGSIAVAFVHRVLHP